MMKSSSSSSINNENLSTKLTKLTIDELNKRDIFGNTILHIICKTDKYDYLKNLLKNKNLNLLITDWENGWNCLHLTIFHKNFIMTNVILQFANSINKLDSLLRQKDREGFTPMDLLSSELNYDRLLYKPISIGGLRLSRRQRTKYQIKEINVSKIFTQLLPICDEIISNSQIDLENITACSFHDLHKPIIKDIIMSNKHSIILTSKKVFISGAGSKGRLGLGNLKNQNSYCPLAVENIIKLALSDDHTLLLNSNDEIFAFGSNEFGQLSFEDSKEILTPRKILIKSKIIDVACSSVHSLCYDKRGIWFWGLNKGQMGFKSDNRIQFQPRRLDFNYDDISQVVCCDFATLVLTTVGEIHLYMNGFHTKFQPPMYNRVIDDLYLFKPRVYTDVITITKMICRGDKVVLLYDNGNILQFTVPKTTTTAADFLKNLKYTTLWKATKEHLKCIDVGLGDDDGSIIICVKDGSVYKRVKRQQQKKKKLFKFDKLPKINNVFKVRNDPAFKNFQFMKLKTQILPLKILKDDFYNDIQLLSIIGTRNFEKEYLETDKIPQNIFNKPRDLQLTSKIPDLKVKYYIKCHDTLIPIHATILHARNKIFRELLDGSKCEEILLEDNIIHMNYDYQVVLLMLHFIYTGHATIPVDLKKNYNKLIELLEITRIPQNFIDLINYEKNDTTIKLKDSTVTCYSYILQSRSVFFEKFFNWKQQDSYTIDLSHLEFSNFQIILQYIHGANPFKIFDDLKFDSIDEFINFVLSCIEISDELLMFELKEFLEYYIIEFISLENVLVLLRHATDLHCLKIFENCLWFIYNNLSYLLFDDEFNSLVNENNHGLLKKLNVSFKFFSNLKIDIQYKLDIWFEQNSELLLRLFVYELPVFNELFNSGVFEPIFEINKPKERKLSITPLTPPISKPASPVNETAIEDGDELEFIEVINKRRKSSALRKLSMNNNIVEPSPSAKARQNSIVDIEEEPKLKLKIKISTKKPTQRERKKNLFEQQSTSSSETSSRSVTPVWTSSKPKAAAPTPVLAASMAPSLSEIMFEQEKSLTPRTAPIRSLEEIQLEEEFERWFQEESLKYQQQTTPPKKPKQKNATKKKIKSRQSSL